MDPNEVETRLIAACGRLYDEQRAFIDVQVNERTLVAFLVKYLEPLFPEWDVSFDYNREGDAGSSKQDREGKLIPDIIVHKALSKAGPNLVAIEVKGHWNPEKRTKDEAKLRRLAAEYDYQHLFRIELEPDTFRILPVVAGN